MNLIVVSLLVVPKNIKHNNLFKIQQDVQSLSVARHYEYRRTGNTGAVQWGRPPQNQAPNRSAQRERRSRCVTRPLPHQSIVPMGSEEARPDHSNRCASCSPMTGEHSKDNGAIKRGMSSQAGLMTQTGKSISSDRE